MTERIIAVCRDRGQHPDRSRGTGLCGLLAILLATPVAAQTQAGESYGNLPAPMERVQQSRDGHTSPVRSPRRNESFAPPDRLEDRSRGRPGQSSDGAPDAEESPWRSWQNGRQEEVRSGPWIHRVQTATEGGEVVLGGTVIPDQQVKLKAQISGAVVYVAGQEGDRFEKDTVLVAVDDSSLLAKRRQVVARIQQARSTLRNANVQYSRELWAPRSESPSQMPGMGMPSLWDQMFTREAGDMMGYGDPELEKRADRFKAGTQVRQARSQLEQARGSLDEIDARLRNTRSYAPFPGMITDKLVEVGDTVQPGVPLVHYADTDRLRLQVDVPVNQISNLQIGQRLPVQLAVGDYQTRARVAQIFPTANQRRHTVKVELDLPEETPGGPGMYGEVRVPSDQTADQSNPVVPYNAVLWRGSLPSVFVVDEAGKAQMRMIRLGGSVGQKRVTVLAGLEPGERVVVNPPSGIHSGYQVTRTGK